MSIIKLYFLFIFGNIVAAEAARILAYYPISSISHQVVFRPVTLELVKRGHEVVVITPDPIFPEGNGPANLKEIDVHDVSYEYTRKYLTSTINGKEFDMVSQARLFKSLSAAIIEQQAAVEDFKMILLNRTDNFDLILLEATSLHALGLTHIYDAPTIWFSSLGAYPGSYEALGAPTHPTIYHNYFRQKLYNLTMWEKLKELYNQIQINYIIKRQDATEYIMMKKIFGDDVPPIDVLKNNVDMMILNINSIWEGNYPVPPNVIHVGGLHQKPRKELPKDLQHYLDSSKNGVIYFSFGTNVKPSLLPPEKIAIFEEVFSKLPYNVMWKWDTENFQAKSANIKIFKWLPQSDLLRHPNVKAFITQGGLQSTDEAITAGVPLIGIPMLADQWYNVEKYVHHKIGVRLDLDKLSEQKLRDAIIDVVENESYRKNIARLRSLMQDQIQTPLERSMWWIEYVLRHKGAKHLRSPTANMSWSEFLELELVCVILLAISLALGSIVLILRFVISYALQLVVNKKLKKT